jgi:hypothetical protein
MAVRKQIAGNANLIGRQNRPSRGRRVPHVVLGDSDSEALG